VESCLFHSDDEVEMLLMNGSKCVSLISLAAEFLSLCQDGTNSSMRSGIMLKNNDNLVEEMSYI
jgi:hypothetical protein